MKNLLVFLIVATACPVAAAEGAVEVGTTARPMLPTCNIGWGVPDVHVSCCYRCNDSAEPAVSDATDLVGTGDEAAPAQANLPECELKEGLMVFHADCFNFGERATT